MVVECYEEVLDYVIEYDFIFEEVFGNYIMVGFFICWKVWRLVWVVFVDVVGLYWLMGVIGVVKVIEEEYSFFLYGLIRSYCIVDVGI